MNFFRVFDFCLPLFDTIAIVYWGQHYFYREATSSSIICLFVFITLFYLNSRKLYNKTEYGWKDLYLVPSAGLIATFFASLVTIYFQNPKMLFPLIAILYGQNFLIYLVSIRIIHFILLQIKKHLNISDVKNVLIVGAGQDGKAIAEEINAHSELKLKVVGFLDDNMNTIEDEDSSIPILGLTCDSDAVIKDNNVKVVIISVKSRMNSTILTDLIKGIPFGVKVWRMPKFYEKINKRYLVSKMTVNWLFYSCVKKKALFYRHVKRFCDIVASIFIMIITLPLSIIAMVGIKLSDLGPVFFTQTRIGKFGKPFEMIKFRTMYQKEVEDDFDDDVTEINADDKRIMPFCKFLRKFHIDELPQMINVLRGEMSLIGPRPVREDLYYENKEKIPFWECRNWVHPGWSGWQQVNIKDPTAEERLEYDLYYIKHRNIVWEFIILLQYFFKVLFGKI